MYKRQVDNSTEFLFCFDGRDTKNAVVTGQTELSRNTLGNQLALGVGSATLYELALLDERILDSALAEENTRKQWYTILLFTVLFTPALHSLQPSVSEDDRRLGSGVSR